MIYICPKCNCMMYKISTASVPSETFYKCFACGYQSIAITEAYNAAVVLPEWLRPEEYEEPLNS